MEDIREWLDSIGCGRYADAFQDNAIEPDLLPELTDEDLRTIGVSALGHRKRILKAISDLSSAIDPVESPLPRSSDGSPRPGGEAERRQLTVMFADLVGSTALSRALDPEELRGLNRAFQDAAKTSIERLGGYVARYMGDGVLAYFGYPLAHENDAERAVRAGLDLVRAIETLNTTVSLSVRIGIATGEVVVGDLIGEGASQESAVVGATPNLAARAQSAAAPNRVSISSGTYALVQGLFDCTELPEVPLKGFPDEHLWIIETERSADSRFEALRSRALTPFVGRGSELGLLLDRWNTAVSGEGQIVLLSGEPGIGKSRLADELRRSSVAAPHVTLRYQCSSHQVNTAYYPFVRQLQRAAGWAGGDEPEKRMDKLEAVLLDTADHAKTLSLMASLFSLPTHRYPPLDLTPQAVKAETLEAFVGQLQALCQAGPVLVVFEDVHWIDPTSLEILDAMIEAAQLLPTLFVITHRPEFDSPWDALGYVTELRLNRLSRRDGMSIIQGVAGQTLLPDAVVQQILEKTDGVALFVEELTKTVLESSQLPEEASANALGVSGPDIRVPSTLRDSLMARLDRLGTAKKIAQMGACIGRDFSYELLQTLSGWPDKELQKALAVLVENQLVFQRGLPPESAYTFKHALVQDAAYDSLLLTRRHELHKSIVGALVDRYRDHVDEVVELLAEHSERGGRWQDAVKYLRASGAKAYARSALREAIIYYRRAASALEHLPGEAGTMLRTIDCLIDERHAHFNLGDMAKAHELLLKAEAIARQSGDEARRGWALVYLGNQSWMAGDSIDCRARVQEGLSIAEKLADPWLTVMACHYLGGAAFTLGDYRETEVAFSRAIASVPDDQSDRPTMGTYPEAVGHAYLAWALGDCGRFAEGIMHGKEGIRVADDAIGQAFTQTWTRWGLAQLYGLLGENEQGLDLIESATEISTKARLTVWPTFLDWSRGHLYARTGRLSEGISLMRGALTAREEQGLHNWNSLLASHLAKALVTDGRLDEAYRVANKGLEVARNHREKGHEAYALHALGQVTALRRGSAAEAAQSLFESAMVLASELGMRALVAHIHFGLGNFLCRRVRDEQEKGDRHLAAAAQMYREMGMRYYLTKAEALSS